MSVEAQSATLWAIEVTFSHMGRSANGMVDSLAKQGGKGSLLCVLLLHNFCNLDNALIPILSLFHFIVLVVESEISLRVSAVSLVHGSQLVTRGKKWF